MCKRSGTSLVHTTSGAVYNNTIILYANILKTPHDCINRTEK